MFAAGYPFGATLMDVAAWLRGLGLEQYLSAFRDNDIDSDFLPQLTVDDLIGLGVASMDIAARCWRRLPRYAKYRQSSPRAQRLMRKRGAKISGAERRQLTVMFCDLVGSTALSARLDPEDLRDVIGAYHRAAADVIRSFDGFVAK